MRTPARQSARPCRRATHRVRRQAVARVIEEMKGAGYQATEPGRP